MAPRPHDADEPPDGDRRDDEQGTSPDDDDVQREWDQIVARLQGPADPRGWEPDPEVAEQDDHFTPPDPGPVLGGDPLLTMAWSAVAGVPVLLFLVYFLTGDLDGTFTRVAAGLWIAGLAVLVWRMPRERSSDDGPGAVV